MTSKETVLAFVDRINAHDVGGLADLMTADHCFIDAHGNQVSGKEKMIAGWRGYFEWFPVYEIEVNEIFERDDTFALFGFAGGSFKGRTEDNWRLPAAWKAIVKDNRILLWQVFADTKIPFDIIERNRKAAPEGAS
jgi:ketosteroid isomerase-like protein